jgi:hypothetical protein
MPAREWFSASIRQARLGHLDRVLVAMLDRAMDKLFGLQRRLANARIGLRAGLRGCRKNCGDCCADLPQILVKPGAKLVHTITAPTAMQALPNGAWSTPLAWRRRRWS